MKTTLKYLVIFGFIFCLSCLDMLAQTGHWEQIFPSVSPSPRIEHGMAQIDKGKVLLFGGANDLNDTWIFDLNKKEWSQVITKNSPPGRFSHGLAKITNRKVLLFGGYIKVNGIYKDTNDTWLFDLDSMNWQKVYPKNVPYSRRCFGISQLSDNKVVIYGGDVFQPNFNNEGLANDVWVFDLNKNNWSKASHSATDSTGRELLQMAYLDEGQALLFGGWNSRLIPFSDNQLFDESLNKFTQINLYSNCTPLFESSMANLEPGKILLFGGNYAYGKGNYQFSWLFNIADTSWKYLEIYSPPGRSSHSLSKIDNGKIICFGGIDDDMCIEYNDTWLFTLDSTTSIPNASKHTGTIISIHQNSSDEINIEYNMEIAGKIDIMIYDLQGTTVFHNENITAESGQQKYSFRMNNAATGVYFVVISSSAGVLFDKFVFIR